MRVLVIGGGAREHALVWKLQFCHNVTAVYAAPGNAGISFLARVSPIPVEDTLSLYQFAVDNRIDLTVVGPEGPLAAGIVDQFQEAGLRIFGPSKAAAQIESSKTWAKEIMQRADVPTARWATATDPDDARAKLREFDLPVVIKADGLAGGKGVMVCSSADEAEGAIRQILVDEVHGEAGRRVVIEEFLDGVELSVFALVDGEHVLPLIGARDYKPLHDGDQGPNTGGMGGFAPAPYATPELMSEVQRTILEPTVQGMAAAAAPYVGVLYAGLMLTRNGPKVLEFNCRWGDPEAELVLPLLRTDLVELMDACLDGCLDRTTVEWHPAATCGIVLAGADYPTHPDRGTKILGLNDIDEGVLAFHGGTRLLRSPDQPAGWLKRALRPTSAREVGVVTDGGRVMIVVATGPTVADARAKAYANADRIQFAGMQYRKDIGLFEVGTAAEQPSEESEITMPDPRATTGEAATVPDRPRPAARSRRGAASARGASAPPAQPRRSAKTAAATGPSKAARGEPATLVAVLMGSESDRPIMDETSNVLERLQIPAEVHVMSAHRTPERVQAFARAAEARGVRVVIAGAGGAAHLPGVIAAQTTLPVIGVPIAGGALMGLDSLLSIVQMPGGVPVATVAVGTAGARNAAYLAAAILGLADEAIRERYRAFRVEQSQGELA